MHIQENNSQRKWEVRLPNGQLGYEHWASGEPKTIDNVNYGVGILHSIRQDRTHIDYGMWNAAFSNAGYAVCQKLLSGELVFLNK